MNCSKVGNEAFLTSIRRCFADATWSTEQHPADKKKRPPQERRPFLLDGVAFTGTRWFPDYAEPGLPGVRPFWRRLPAECAPGRNSWVLPRPARTNPRARQRRWNFSLLPPSTTIFRLPWYRVRQFSLQDSAPPGAVLVSPLRLPHLLARREAKLILAKTLARLDQDWFQPASY